MARRGSRLALVALILLGITAGGLAARTQADEPIPDIGARVRVRVSGLWPGWHMGMFNQLRVPAACYRVLVFGPTRTVERMLSIREIERMQVSRLYDGRARVEPAEPDEWTYAGETWREVPMAPLREAEQRCSGT